MTPMPPLGWQAVAGRHGSGVELLSSFWLKHGSCATPPYGGKSCKHLSTFYEALYKRGSTDVEIPRDPGEWRCLCLLFLTVHLQQGTFNGEIIT